MTPDEPGVPRSDESPDERPEESGDLLEAPGPDERRYVAGRLGRAIASFDRSLSERPAEAVSKASEQLGETARSRLMSGKWQNYAFLILLAIVGFAAVVLATRGCWAVGGP